MGCAFCGKTEPAIAIAEFWNALVNTGEIKQCQRRQKAGLELQLLL
jgi:hypothetical protein